MTDPKPAYELFKYLKDNCKGLLTNIPANFDKDVLKDLLQ